MNEELVRLSGLWYDIVSLDHYKDKDCHFCIEKRYSYGNNPTYEAYHFGYVGEDYLESFDSVESAERGLVGLLKRQINDQYTMNKLRVSHGDESEKKDAQRVIDLINKYKNENKN